MSNIIINPYRFGEPAFAPTDISGLQLWLDASDTSTITHSSGSVSQWDDKSGNANHVTQGTASLQLSTGTRTLNSLNVLEYPDGNGRFMNGDNPTQSVAGTYFFVFKNDTSNFYATCRFTSAFLYIAQNGSSSSTINSGVGSPSLRVNGSAESPTTRGDVYTLYGTTAKIITAKSVNSSESVFRTAYNSSTIATIGVHAEILAYDSVLSASDTSTIETYLADKWGITL